MKAIVLNEIGAYPSFVADAPMPMPADDEVIVKVAYAALNRRDYWITQGQYPGIKTPTILGSDGAGYIGDRRVIIYPASDWGEKTSHQAENFNVLGMPQDGTLAEYIAVKKDYVFDAPEYLTDAEAGAFGLAGLTAYRALFTRAEIRKGETVLVNGVGGGVALMATQLAMAAGAAVYVTSGSDEKIAQAIKLGAKGGFNYKKEDWYKDASQQGLQFDIIVDSAGGPGFPNLLKITAPGGRIVTYGGTLGAIPKINTQLLFWRQISILGSTMGSPTEFRRLLNFASKHQIRPIIDKLYHWDTVDEAFDAMKYSTQFGKIVFSLQ